MGGGGVRIRDVWWTPWSVEHIARHGVTTAEVEGVVFAPPFYVSRVTADRFLVVRQTYGGRYLSIILDREESDLFFVVIARDAAPKERRAYDRRFGHRRG